MTDGLTVEPAGLVAKSRRDGALDEALPRLAPDAPPDRPDTPDLHVTAVRRLPAVPAQYAPFPDALDPRLRAALGVARHLAALHPPGGGDRSCARRPARRRHHADGVGQDALLQRAGAARDPAGPVEPRAVSLSDQGARAGPARRAAGDVRDAGGAVAGRRRRADRRVHLRRRHAAGRAADDSRPRAPRAQQSRHAALGDPAAPSALGEAVREPALRRHRRAARVSRRVRQPSCATCCGGCGASAATTDPNPVFICSSATIANPRELAERLTEQPFELVAESGAPRGEKFFVFVNPPVVNHQLGIRRSYLGETRRIAAEFLKRNLQLIVFAQSRLATEILTTYLKDDFEERAGRAGADSRLSRRLPAEPAARDREGAARRRRARGRLDQRARARHRHRRARRLRDGRISGHDCRHLAACRPRRPPRRPIGGRDGGQQRAARSVRRPESVVFLRRLARARADRSGQPAHPRRSHQVRGVRAAVQHDARRSAATMCRRFSASSPSRDSCIARGLPTTSTRRRSRASGRGRTSRIRPTR